MSSDLSAKDIYQLDEKDITENGSVKIYNIKTKGRQSFKLDISNVVPFKTEEDGEVIPESQESFIRIKGIASSTSVDHYGTEMSFKALVEMKKQIEDGVVILPRHESLTGSGLAEWDEVIGRTSSAEIKEADIVKPSGFSKKGFVLEVESELYEDNSKTKALLKRLKRGEPIGQSIGGWFESVRVEEDKDGEIKNIIVESVTLDHIAITRAPANPDSSGLSLLNIRSSIKSFLEDRRQFMTSDNSTPELEEGLEANLLSEDSDIEVRDASMDAEPLPVDPLTEDMEPKGEAHIDASSPEDPLSGSELESGNATADQSAVPFSAEYEAMKMEMEKMKEELQKMKEERLKEERLKEERLKEERDLEDEDDAEKEDHEIGALADDEDHIQALEEDEEEDAEDLAEDEIEERTALPFHAEIPLAAEDVPWEWNTTTQDEVLGKGLDNWDRYKDAHLYMDQSKDPQTKSAYKLPIARMINGELRVVLRGVQAAMAALNGARGGVDIPEEERFDVYKTIKSYYERFGKTAPDLANRSTVEQDPVVGLDNNPELNNSSINTLTNLDDNKDSDNRSNEMKPEDIKSLIEQVTRSVVSEMTKVSEEKKPQEQEETRSKAVEAAYGVKEPSVEELKARLDRAEETLSRVLEQPLRKGRHVSASVRGIGSEHELDHMISISESEGNQSLAAVMKRNKDQLLREPNESLPKVMTNHQLKDLLSKGLRAAYLDGILGTPVDGWQ